MERGFLQGININNVSTKFSYKALLHQTTAKTNQMNRSQSHGRKFKKSYKIEWKLPSSKREKKMHKKLCFQILARVQIIHPRDYSDEFSFSIHQVVLEKIYEDGIRLRLLLSNPDLPLGDWLTMNKLERGTWVLASCQVSLKSLQQFLRKGLKYSQTDR